MSISLKYKFIRNVNAQHHFDFNPLRPWLTLLRLVPVWQKTNVNHIFVNIWRFNRLYFLSCICHTHVIRLLYWKFSQAITMRLSSAQYASSSVSFYAYKLMAINTGSLSKDLTLSYIISHAMGFKSDHFSFNKAFVKCSCFDVFHDIDILLRSLSLSV